jgi:hypothetical protein
MPATSHAPPAPPAEGLPGPNVRTIASLLLFMHLFCLLVALSSSGRNFSRLQVKLTNAVAPYLLFTKIAPSASFDLTNGMWESFDHFVEVEVTAGPEQGQVLRLPEGRVAGSLPQGRVELLARTMGVTNYVGNDPNTAAFAKAIGATVLDQGQNERVVVRLKRYDPQERDFDSTNPATPPDPTAPEYVKTLYEAQVWRDRHGLVQLLKMEEKKVVAPLE